MATYPSPNPLNYFLGKGIVSWKGTNDTDFRLLGNVPLFEITPQVTRLPHYSAMRGIRFLDFNPVISKLMTVKFHMEEFTPENLAIALMGTYTPGTPDNVDILIQDEVTGMLRLLGTNEIGQKKQVDLPFVNIAPSAAVQFIGEAYGILEVTGEVTGDPTTGSFGQIREPVTGEITSSNWSTN